MVARWLKDRLYQPPRWTITDKLLPEAAVSRDLHNEPRRYGPASAWRCLFWRRVAAFILISYESQRPTHRLYGRLFGSGHRNIHDEHVGRRPAGSVVGYRGRVLYEGTDKGRSESESKVRSCIPGIWGGIDTPNYSPDNQHIIFGYAGFDGVNVYRINSDGSNCTLLYESEGSYFATEARYSPDGTKIALFHRVDIIAGGQGENAGPFTQRILRVIDSTTGEILNDYQPPNFWSSPVWSPDGSEIAYLGGSIDPEGNEVANNEIWTFDLTTQIPEQVLFDGVPEAFQGLSWRVPAAATPLLRIRINDPNPVTAGQSTTGTVYLSAPAPAGERHQPVSLGATGIIDLPQSSVTVPEGATERHFRSTPRSGSTTVAMM